MKKSFFILAVFLFGTVMTYAQIKSTGVVVGGCTPKIGDDVELSIHTPQNTDPSIGQVKGVKYQLLTIVQGGKREGTSIKGGARTTMMIPADQKELAATLAALAPGGNKGGAKLGMCRISKISGPFKMGRGDKVTITAVSGSCDAAITNNGKVIGSFTITLG